MKLVIGGTFQGKKEFAGKQYQVEENKICDGRECGFDEIYGAGMITHFHEYIKRRMEAELPYLDLANELYEKNPDLIVVSNELGYGIVPIDAFDRRFREDTGRILCKLAELSDEVYRVCCGIGTKIKG